MTHDERRLLCLVARCLVAGKDPDESASSRELLRLVGCVQRHAQVENGRAARGLLKGFDGKLGLKIINRDTEE